MSCKSVEDNLGKNNKDPETGTACWVPRKRTL